MIPGNGRKEKERAGCINRPRTRMIWCLLTHVGYCLLDVVVGDGEGVGEIFDGQFIKGTIFLEGSQG